MDISKLLNTAILFDKLAHKPSRDWSAPPISKELSEANALYNHIHDDGRKWLVTKTSAILKKPTDTLVDFIVWLNPTDETNTTFSYDATLQTSSSEIKKWLSSMEPELVRFLKAKYPKVNLKISTAK